MSQYVITEDVVYMESEEEKGEYVLNEQGRIWVGSARNNYGRPWNFGQVGCCISRLSLDLIAYINKCRL